jgi:hypothetical protein
LITKNFLLITCSRSYSGCTFQVFTKSVCFAKVPGSASAGRVSATRKTKPLLQKAFHYHPGYRILGFIKKTAIQHCGSIFLTDNYFF